MRSARSSSVNQAAAPAMALSSPWGGAERGTSRILSSGEEFELVSRLGKLRTRLERQLRPIVKKAPLGTKLDHFDQVLAYYQAAPKIPKSFARKIDRDVREYNQIKHSLVVANLAWVTKLARSQRQTTVAEEDLFQEGVCGLLKAIDRFEAERGLRLMTYATWYIREAMQQIRARQSHLVSLSSHDQTLLGQLEAQRTAFQHQHQRLPDPSELGQGTRATVRAVSRLQRVSSPAVSLERGGADGSIPVPVGDPTLEFDRLDEIQTTVSKLLETLPTRERLIVTRRFGLDGQEPTSLEVLGDDLKVSKERVRQLQRQAIRRMQQQAEEEKIEFAAV